MTRKIIFILINAFSISVCAMDFDKVSDSIEAVQILYAREKQDSSFLYDIRRYRFNELRKRSGVLLKLKRGNSVNCCENRNDTIILLDMTNCEGMTYYSQAWNTKKTEELLMYRLLNDTVIYIDEELLLLEKNNQYGVRYRQLCNDWRPDIFQKEWSVRANTLTGCWHYLVTRVIFAGDKLFKIDFEYISKLLAL